MVERASAAPRSGSRRGGRHRWAGRLLVASAVAVCGLTVPAGASAAVPFAPNKLTAASPTRVAPVLHWSTYSKAGRYRVLRGSTLVGRVRVGAAALKRRTIRVSFTDRRLGRDGSFVYSVYALTSKGQRSKVRRVRVVFDRTRPTDVLKAPTEVSPTTGRASISWTAARDRTSGVRRYAVQRDGKFLAWSARTTFTDARPVAGAHTYRVRAYDRAGNRARHYSPSVTIVTPADTSAPPVIGAAPASPQGLSASALDGAVRLQWSSSDVDVSRYEVNFKRTVDTTWSVAVGVTSPHTVTNLVNGMSYDFAVRVVDSAGNPSPWSTTISAQPQAVVTTAPTVMGPTLRRYLPAYMSEYAAVTSAEARRMARQFDLIVAQNNFTPHLADMKAVNPDLVVLVYIDGMLAGSRLTRPENEYAHDVNGQRVYLSQWGKHVMEPSSPGWRSFTASRCRNWMDTSGFDGCFLDNMGAAVFEAGYAPAVPANPSTGLAWTKAGWLNATTQLTQTVQEAVPGHPVYPNGIQNGSKWFDPVAPTSVLAMSSGGAMPEVFVRADGWAVTTYKSESLWKQDVDMLADAQAKGKILFTTTKLWTTATEAQADAVRKYAMASFLLGAGSRSYFNFSTARSLASVSLDHRYERVDIGMASGPYAKVGGVYRRDFERGRVLVNPTTNTVEVPLGAAFRDLDGVQRSSVVLAPNSAEVLTRLVV